MPSRAPYDPADPVTNNHNPVECANWGLSMNRHCCLIPYPLYATRMPDVGRDGMLSHCCEVIDILGVAGTAPMVLESESLPSLAVRKNCMSLAPSLSIVFLKKLSVWRELPFLTVPV
jgi:hypothetical protein